jgi:hypothetical protein
MSEFSYKSDNGNMKHLLVYDCNKRAANVPPVEKSYKFSLVIEVGIGD